MRWALLRSPTNDVDLLMDPAHLEAAARVLSRDGFVRLPGRPSDSHHHFVRYDADGGWMWLDVQTSLGYGPCRTFHPFRERDLLERRERGPSGYVLAKDDAFWVLLLHCLLNRDAISAAHRVDLACLADASVQSGDVVLRRLNASCEAATILHLVRRGEWGAVEALRPALLAGIRPGPRRVSPFARLHAGWRWRGLTVAVLGPDGAGKSTLTNALAQNFPWPASLIYGGLHTPRMRLARRLPFGLSLPALAAILWARQVRALYHRARGRLVVFDRYGYDAFLDSSFGRQGSLMRTILASISLPPDVTLILDAPGETAFERKGGHKHAVDELEEARRGYRRLASTLPNAHLLDASLPAADVLSRALEATMEAYRARWRSV